jgi:hypothetical protein
MLACLEIKSVPINGAKLLRLVFECDEHRINLHLREREIIITRACRYVLPRDSYDV